MPRQGPAGHRAGQPQCAIIAAVKGWHAAWAAFLFFIPPHAGAAEDGNGAARELARKTSALQAAATRSPYHGGTSPRSVWRNWTAPVPASKPRSGKPVTAISEAGSVTSADDPLRKSRAIPAGGGESARATTGRYGSPVGPAAPPRLPRHSGGIARKKTGLGAKRAHSGRRASPQSGMLVLSPGKITLYARSGTAWTPASVSSVHLAEALAARPAGAPAREWPGVPGYAPGQACTGTTDPSLTLDCQPSEEPWVLESGSRGCCSPISLPAGTSSMDRPSLKQACAKPLRPSTPPRRSRSRAGLSGCWPWWMAARRFSIPRSNPGHALPLGQRHRRHGGQVRRRRAGAGHASGRWQRPRSVQAFTVANRRPPAAPPADFPGPVTALWTIGRHFGHRGGAKPRDRKVCRHMSLRWFAALSAGSRWRRCCRGHSSALRRHVAGRNARSHETADPPQSGHSMAQLDGRLSASPNGRPPRHALYTADENAPGGRPFLDAVEIQMGRRLRDAVHRSRPEQSGHRRTRLQRIRRAPAAARIWSSSPVRLLALVFVPVETGGSAKRSPSRWTATAIHNVLLQRQGEISGALLPQWLSGLRLPVSTAAGSAPGARAGRPGFPRARTLSLPCRSLTAASPTASRSMPAMPA